VSFSPIALAWLGTHHGTIAGDPALPVAERRRLVRAGQLSRVVHGAYRFAAAPDDELARCAAICTSRPALVIAGPTAARLWAMRRAPGDGLVHVIAPPASNPCREAWVRAYRTDSLLPSEVVLRPDGIRLTSPPRTVVDVARYLGDVELASLLEDVLERGMCTATTLRRIAERLVVPRRPWATRVLDLLDARRDDSPAESEWELRVASALRGRGVEGLITQHTVDLPGYGPARFDLAIPTLRWAAEVDVHPSHRSLEGAASDGRRDLAADRAGWTVHRVTELMLTSAFDTTIDELVASIERRRAHLDRHRAQH